MPSQSLSNSHFGRTYSPPRLFLLLSMTLHGPARPLGQLGSAVLAVSPLTLLPTPSLFAEGAE